MGKLGLFESSWESSLGCTSTGFSQMGRKGQAPRVLLRYKNVSVFYFSLSPHPSPCVCVCVCICCVCAYACMRVCVCVCACILLLVSEDRPRESVLSLPCVDHRPEHQLSALQPVPLPAEPSHWPPPALISSLKNKKHLLIWGWEEVVHTTVCLEIREDLWKSVLSVHHVESSGLMVKTFISPLNHLTGLLRSFL